jgi:hypothetical protein
MVSTVSSIRRVRIELNEAVVLVIRQPTAAEVSRLSTSRTKTKGTRVEFDAFSARVAFAKPLLVDVENASYETAAGEQAPLGKSTNLSEADRAHLSSLLGERVERWQDVVPPAWLESVGMIFEPKMPEDGGKN